MKKPKQREFQQWDQPVKLWGITARAKRQRTRTFALLLKSLLIELEKENKGAENGIFSSSSVSVYSCLLTILGRKDERGKWKRSYKISMEERGKRVGIKVKQSDW